MSDKEVMVREADGSLTWETIADAGAVTVAGTSGLSLATSGALALATAVAGKRLLNTNGVLSVVAPDMGAAVAIATTSSVGALTAAGVVGGLIRRSGLTEATTDTAPTAADIVALLNDPANNDSFNFAVSNLSTAHAVTLATAAGITLAGTTTIAAAKTRVYRATVTNVDTPAVTITGVLTADI